MQDCRDRYWDTIIRKKCEQGVFTHELNQKPSVQSVGELEEMQSLKDSIDLISYSLQTSHKIPKPPSQFICSTSARKHQIHRSAPPRSTHLRTHKPIPVQAEAIQKS